jgi:hypothetical protein
MVASVAVLLSRLIIMTYPLDQLESGLRSMESGGKVMKLLVKCAEEPE